MAYTQLSPHLRPMRAYAFTASAFLSATIGAFTLSSQATVLAKASLTQSIGQITLSAQTTAQIRASLTQSIGNITLLANALHGANASLDQVIGNITLSSAGVVTGGMPTGFAIVDVTLAPIVLTANVAVAGVANLIQTLGPITLSAFANANLSGSPPIIPVGPTDFFVDIIHNENNIATPIFVMTNWPTSHWFSGASENSTRVYFSQQPSGTSPTVAWRVAK